ncbi:MAG: type II secretion system protein [Elusimicrobia bacterium]|nr:type II secretion system protein [Elusimicrobiota bacterium]
MNILKRNKRFILTPIIVTVRLKSKLVRGFTLIELMVVVTIIAIMASIAIPKFSEMMQRARESATKGNLGNCRTAIGIYYGRNDAMYPYRLSGDPPVEPLYEIEGGDADQNWGAANGSPDGMYTRGWSEEVCNDFKAYINKLPESAISPDSSKKTRSGVWNDPDPNNSPSGNHNGWFYCFRKGEVVVNNNGIDMKGNPYTSW